MKKFLLSCFLGCLPVLLSVAYAAENKMDSEIQSQAKRATDRGLHYLRGQQAEDGSWSGSVGVTALALRAFLTSHRGYSEDDGAFIVKPVEYLLGHVKPDGSISETSQNASYNTATAIVALEATGNLAYKEVIKNAQNFLKNLQIDEAEGYEPSHKYYGGIGYGGDERPDLSNIYYAMEALHNSKLDRQDPTWQKALTFISRCQNRSESNDQPGMGNDGGFAYMPGFSPHGEAVSYGAMTHAGLISLIFAGADKDDPRVQSAYDWIRSNYTVAEHPGAKNNQGLFYYYAVFAKSMYAFDEPMVTDLNGVQHNWRDDLARQLISMQAEDGSWVNPYSNRWWEGDKNLVTARSVIALNLAVQ